MIIDEPFSLQKVVQFVQYLLTALFRARPEGYLISFGLMLPIAVKALLSLRQIRNLLVEEERALNRYRQSIKQNTALTRSLVLDVCRTADENYYVGIALQTVYSCRNQEHIDVSSIWSTLSSKGSERIGFLRSVPNVLLLIGLLGTVVGLAQAVGQLAPQISRALDATEPNVLTKALSETVTHMQTAFFCTLWGIIAAVVITLQLRDTEARQIRLISSIAEFVTRHVIPVIAITERAHIEQIHQAVDRGQQFLNKVSKTMQTVGQKFSDVTDSLARSLQDTTIQFMETLNTAQSIANSLNQTTNTILGALQASEEQLRKASQQLVASADNLIEGHRQLQAVQEALLAEYSQSRLRLEEQIAGQLGELRNVQEALDEKGTQIISNIHKAIDAINKQIHEDRRYVEVMRHELGTAREGVRHDLSKAARRMEDAFTRLLNTLESVESAIRALREELHKSAGIKLDVSPPGKPREPVETLSFDTAPLVEEIKRVEQSLMKYTDAILQCMNQFDNITRNILSAGGQPATEAAQPVPTDLASVENLLKTVVASLECISRDIRELPLRIRGSLYPSHRSIVPPEPSGKTFAVISEPQAEINRSTTQNRQTSFIRRILSLRPLSRNRHDEKPVH